MSLVITYMKRIPVILRSRDDPGVPAHETQGWVPAPDCPLAITRVFNWKGSRWFEDKKWRVTHRPTGWGLGQNAWSTRKEAEAVLLACDPDFPAWVVCTGAKDDPATVACAVKFRAAVAVGR